MPRTFTGAPPNATAAAAYALSGVDPHRACQLAEAVLAGRAEPTDMVLALRALALATRRLAGPRAALPFAAQALRVAGAPDEAHAHAQMTHAALLAECGRTRQALAACRAAAEAVRGVARGPVFAQLALLASRAGDLETALQYYRKALPLLRRGGDIHGQCRLFLNRANSLAYAGRLDAAQRDIERAARLAAEFPEYRSTIAENLGFVMLCRGDIPAALRCFADAAESADPYGRLAIAHDRAFALLTAGLAGEARSTLESFMPRLAAAGFDVDVAEWYLLAARAALTEADWEAAIEFARQAGQHFRSQHRPRWNLLARQVEVTARLSAGARDRRILRWARRLAEQLVPTWPEAAIRLVLVCGDGAAQAGWPTLARDCFESADRWASRSGPRRRPATWRAAARYARARLRALDGDRRGAAAQLRTGLRIVQEHALSFGATDLRVGAAVHGREFAEEGLRSALRSGRGRVVLEWAEIARATVLRTRPVRPPSDPVLAAQMAELRRVTARLGEAALSTEEQRLLRSRQARLEEAIRDRVRHGKAARAVATDDRHWQEALITTLADRTLVEYASVDGHLFAITLRGRRATVIPLGGYQQALHHARSLRFSVVRLARRHGSAAALAAAREARDHALLRLHELLLRPLKLPQADVVVVPTGELHALPWPMLLPGWPVAVAPSARLWLRAATATGSGRAVVLAAGPGLGHAEEEIRALAALYPEALSFTGGHAAVPRILAAIDGARLVHIAAHGHFRSDNPQFSALDLADGPLTVYDLENLRRAPEMLVFSACESGLSAVRPGDELMGLAAALFSLGTRTLVASVCPIPDAETKDFMTCFHAALRRGLRPALALSQTQRQTTCDGFVCFGAG
ncbi:MAG: CHAT domain-containing protein [Acidothermus sp.]|nr:CHAT domain-containing protein [Acidothermus sp.]MCL6537157.1 CHAT domain-containing protein [Acidothermus sp.]